MQWNPEISYRSADFAPALPDTCSLSPNPPSKSYDRTQAMKIRSSGRAVFKIFQMNKQYFLTRMTRNPGRNRRLAFARHSQSFLQHFASALGSKLHSKGSWAALKILLPLNRQPLQEINPSVSGLKHWQLSLVGTVQANATKLRLSSSRLYVKSCQMQKTLYVCNPVVD